MRKKRNSQYEKYRRPGPPLESVDVSGLTDDDLFALYDDKWAAYAGYLRNGQGGTADARLLHKWLVAISDEIARRGRSVVLSWVTHKEFVRGRTHG